MQKIALCVNAEKPFALFKCEWSELNKTHTLNYKHHTHHTQHTVHTIVYAGHYISVSIWKYHCINIKAEVYVDCIVEKSQGETEFKKKREEITQQ